MRVTVFGANGKTGKEVVKFLLSCGDEVVAAVRRPETVKSADHLTVMQVDLKSPMTLRAAMKGSDVIISTIGSGESSSPTTIYSDSVRALRAVMRELGIKRLLVCSSSGVEHDDQAPWLYSNLFRKYIMNTYMDMMKMETILEETPDLDWTSVRLSDLCPSNQQKNILTSDRALRKGNFKISYRHAAEFIVNEMFENRWIRKCPAVGYK